MHIEALTMTQHASHRIGGGVFFRRIFIVHHAAPVMASNLLEKESHKRPNVATAPQTIESARRRVKLVKVTETYSCAAQSPHYAFAEAGLSLPSSPFGSISLGFFCRKGEIWLGVVRGPFYVALFAAADMGLARGTGTRYTYTAHCETV